MSTPPPIPPSSPDPSLPPKWRPIRQNKPELPPHIKKTPIPPLSSYDKKQPWFFERAKKLISWLMGRDVHQAQILAEEINTFEEKELAERALHIQELKKYTKEEVFTRAQIALARLEKTKSILLQEFGDASLGFIFRHIDPVLSSSKKLLDALGQLQERLHAKNTKDREQKEHTVADLLAGMVDAVELYAIINDEEHLKRRVVHHIQDNAEQAIQKDVQILMAYYATAFDEITSSTETHKTAIKALMKFVDQELEPVFAKIDGLMDSFPVSLELTSIFSWRQNFDFMRHGLISLATHIIDIHISRFCFFSWYYDAHPVQALDFDVSTINFITDSQIQESGNLINQCVETELFLIDLQQYYKTVEDPHLTIELKEVLSSFQITLEALFSQTKPFTSHSIAKFTEELSLNRTLASHLIYPTEPPGL